MNEVYLTALVGVITSLGTWFAARRKNLADVQGSEIENIEKAVKFYREQFEHITDQWKIQVAETERLNQILQGQAEETRKLHVENRQLIEQNKALIEELKKYKQLNGKTVNP